jgi:hypothetical protein
VERERAGETFAISNHLQFRGGSATCFQCRANHHGRERKREDEDDEEEEG